MQPWTREEMTAVLRSPRWYDWDAKDRALAARIQELENKYCRAYSVIRLADKLGSNPARIRAALATYAGVLA